MRKIRRIEIGEVELYRETRLKSLRESPNAYSSKYDDAASRSEESWRSQVDASAAGGDRATFIMLDEHPVGLAALYRSENCPRDGELIQVWIAPEERGGSAAAELVEEIFRWAADNGFLRVRAEVMPGNSRALRFFEKNGFTR
ncbi:MAG: GNAT family N-acetyltransferase [Verrucomicrobiales bacterium]|nr:GNAT family N-acetyltransferase [Verrucomicrobiales bacterium]